MKRNQLKAGLIISYINLLIGNLIPLVYTPIMLRILGSAEYGLYGIAQSIMGYISLLNFGIGGAIVRYLSKYRAENDDSGERRIAGLFIKIYVLISLLILAAGLFSANHLNIFGRSLMPDELVILKKLVILMTVNMALFLPFNVFSSIVIAHEKFIFQKLVSMLQGIAVPCLSLVLLIAGMGSVGMVLSATILNACAYALYVIFAVCKIKFRPSFAKVEKSVIKEIVGFSFFVFIGSLVDMIYWSTDRLIIGWAIGSTATAVYNIGATFNTYVMSFSTAISGLLVPRLTKMAVKETPKEEFTQIFIKVGRLQFILISFIVSAFVAFGKQFILIWAGPEYEQGYTVALLVMLPITVPLIQNTGINILHALNKHRFRSAVYACIAALNVLLTFWWVEKYGIIGAAIATCIAYVIGNILIINWYYHKKVGIDIPLFWENILKMSPVMVIMGGSWWLLLHVIGIRGWTDFFVLAGIYTLLYAVLSYRFMFNEYEKNLLKSAGNKIKNSLKLG